MARLPVVKARVVIRALERAGFEVVRSKGSHFVMRHVTDYSRRTVIADHGSIDLPRGTLAGILEQAGLTVDEFLKLL